MKTVFKSDEIAHIWANKGATYGRSPGDLSFDGDAIKSYATVIARRISRKGRVAYILDYASFSSSTAKSQSRVHRALRDDAKLFLINSGVRGQTLNWSPAELRNHYLKRAADLEAEMPSRYMHVRVRQYDAITALLKSAQDVCQFFTLGHKALDAKIQKRETEAAKGAEILAAHRQKLIARKAKDEARELKARTERNVKQAKEFLAGKALPDRIVSLETNAKAFATLPDDLRIPLVDMIERHNAAIQAKQDAENAEAIAKWLAGESVNLPHDAATLLRAEGDEMITTKGARVPLSDAARTYAFVIKRRAKGWHANGEQHSIGAYALEAVNDSGVIVGCHRVTWQEIERFAASQGWNKASA